MVRRLFGVVTSLAVVLAGLTVTPVAEADPSEAAIYQNPVGSPAADVFADPSVIRGRDGYWYAYSTSGPRFRGDTGHKMKILRSTDLVTWSYVGDVFTAETEPRYDGYGDAGQRFYWAPAIEYFQGQYFLYYSYVANHGQDKHFRVIAVATAPTPAGPWTDSGEAVIDTEQWEPFPGETAWANTIDPEVVTAGDGSRYLYWGSVLGGVRAARLSDNGLSVEGERVQLTPSLRYEAAYVVQREGWYYLMLSAIGGCCAGPVSAYPVLAGRSRHPLGPFVDRDGVRLDQDHAGGTPVVAPNGNPWVSTGHHAIATDPSGQDWIVQHGTDRFDPFVNGGSQGENKRGLHIARLDWIDGWPTVRAGQGMPDGQVRAPATATLVNDAFEDPHISEDVWGRQAMAGWSAETESAGTFRRSPADGGALLSPDRLRGDLRLRAQVRIPAESQDPAGLQIEGPGRSARHEIRLDPVSRQLVINSTRPGGSSARATAPLPDDFAFDDWHDLSVNLRDGRLAAEVSAAGLGDPVAGAALDTGRGIGGLRVGVAADGATDFDDVTAAPLYSPVEEKVPDPASGDEIPGWSETFDGPLSPAWSWIREPSGSLEEGALRLQMQPGSMINNRPSDDNSASLFLRDAPEGTWTAETQLHVPFGSEHPESWPQAGLIAYADDDNWTMLSLAARSNSRWIGFGKEMTFGSSTPYADARLPGSADTVWLRLRHTVNPDNGEHLYRAAVSRDGEHWVQHGTRVLEAGPQPRIGLAGFDSAEPREATFDYLRFSRG